MKKILKIISLILVLLLINGCSTHKLENANINTTIYPIHFLTEYLYGEGNKINSIYPAGAQPQNYKLSHKQIKEYAQADLFIYNGLTKEKEIAKELINTNKKILIIDVSYGLKYSYGIEELWLSPNNFLMLGKNIKEYLISYLKNETTIDKIKQNYHQLEEEISMMDAQLREIATIATQEKHSKTLVSSSNVFKYLKNYGFEVISLEDEENLSHYNLNQIKKNFENGNYHTIFMLKKDSKTDLIKQLIDKYKANIILVDEMYVLNSDLKDQNENYVTIMNAYIDNIRTTILK